MQSISTQYTYPDYIALLDPVFGVDNWVGPDDKPRGKTIINWCQDNGKRYSIKENPPTSPQDQRTGVCYRSGGRNRSYSITNI
ncbi:hypothetical protein H1230_16885 [Paenibacillus sp. 19GGS1-52]|uniref:hypothetical protein n=1 Tax=Paenibacillus sp. 19GGS1-52 TaxID=2758563 RepID=UPI001EFB7429|nr:hypothetical protein [Paenibacillus sp. 19GGS1-52]ULO04822.1 hypothetical protein H1230_16885 [Paenibacillus sp. 19GGS1-52]